MTPRLTMFACIKIKPEHYDEAKRTLLSIVHSTLEEEGCFTFDVYEGDDGRLHLFEEWAGEEGLRYHLEQDYTKDALAQFGAWIAAPIQVVRLELLDKACFQSDVASADQTFSA